MRAVWRRAVDFPAMFGPVTTCSCASGVNVTEFGVNTRLVFNKPRSTVGWRPSRTSYEELRLSTSIQQWKTSTYSSLMTGLTIFISEASVAKAKVTSSSSKMREFLRNGPERALTSDSDQPLPLHQNQTEAYVAPQNLKGLLFGNTQSHRCLQNLAAQP
jgi:hypothetical protein